MTTRKTCSRCGEDRPCTDYQRSAQTRDGLRSQCRSCNSQGMRQWLAKPENRERFNQQARERQRRDAAKVSARRALNKAIARGDVTVRPCVVGIHCDGRIEAHHEDYAKPLEVVWLCRKHHEALHHATLTLPDMMERAA